MNVGIIGTGTMGKPMAHNILKAGHRANAFYFPSRSIPRLRRWCWAKREFLQGPPREQ
jgi:3-hydroxyisobutyrate dehydrogenase-like beta-hydroxyacid dehydrogenase